MNVPLPAELEQYVDEKIAGGAFASRDAFVAEAVRLYREFELLQDLLRSDIRATLEQSDHAASAPMEMEAIRRELLEELDEKGRPS